jgi:cardiolipin synthase
MNRNLGSLPMVGGNSAELIESYSGSFQAMAEAIDRAEHFVHVEFFILVQDEATVPVFDALERACKRGVKVRVLSDHVAQFMYPHRKATVGRFAAMGAEYRPMLPLQPFRGHWRRPPQSPEAGPGGRHCGLHRLAELDHSCCGRA